MSGMATIISISFSLYYTIQIEHANNSERCVFPYSVTLLCGYKDLGRLSLAYVKKIT